MVTTLKCASDYFCLCVLLVLLREVYSPIKEKFIVTNVTNQPGIILNHALNNGRLSYKLKRF